MAVRLLKKHNNDYALACKARALETSAQVDDLTKDKSQTKLNRGHCDTPDADSDSEFEDHDWDFTLPRVPVPLMLLNGIPFPGSYSVSGWDSPTANMVETYDGNFSLDDVVGAIQGGETCERIRSYLTHYHQYLGTDLAGKVNGTVEGIPHSSSWLRRETAIKTLLSLGASVNVIPKAFYWPLERDLPSEGPPDEELTDLKDKEKRWCVASARRRITASLNRSFTQRYVLHLASYLARFSGATRKITRLHKADGLFGVQYFLIGQTMASRLLIDRLVAYLPMPVKRPIVLLFAGPSGHGKTKLATNLGKLTSLAMHVADCTSINRETDLFGPRMPYRGYEDGSPLNNFIANHNGQRRIIFLDEFEKTRTEIHQTLQIPFESASEKKAKKLVRTLSTTIQEQCIFRFGAPITSRITDFLPFLTFSPCEQAAVADEYLSEFGQEAAKPLKDSDDASKARLVGNIDLQVRRGYSVCKALAKEGYVQELGARSVINIVDQKVKFPLISAYLETREEIREDQPTSVFVLGVGDKDVVEVSQSSATEPGKGLA
ncbi:P-loop containing nucleoside triphosphate hydrolase protein [Podospora appendiculata]|uniref:P-loop containing nucleoside triphosphate hydrolase protein n=1 Tax=Podospora appendiculata TaxID=314037 RepID=A0AAE0X8Z8_9PEZI|nr:P-loop containing nucleoside triphosphate hydrolase protein [Podospora appendiculata]